MRFFGEGSESKPNSNVVTASAADESISVSLVELRDGRVFVGVLKSFDHFGNLLLEHASERFLVRNVCYELAHDNVYQFPAAYADLFLGCMLIRGENVAFFGRDESTPLEDYLLDLRTAADEPGIFADTLRARAAQAVEAHALSVQLPLSTVLSAREEGVQRRQHASKVWAEYSRRLRSLANGRSMEDSFVESMLVNAGKGGGRFSEAEMKIIRGLFAKYVANATDALLALSEEDGECGDEI